MGERLNRREFVGTLGAGLAGTARAELGDALTGRTGSGVRPVGEAAEG